jgi:hypothetical protein
MSILPRGLLLLPLLSVVACGASRVRLYGGAELPDDHVTSIVTNPHLQMSIDDQHEIAGGAKLQRLELPAGPHTLELRCLYTDDVPYKAATGDGPAPPASAEGKQYTASPMIAASVDGKPGKVYKPRVRFTRDDKGIPGCQIKMVEVSKGGEDEHLY